MEKTPLIIITVEGGMVCDVGVVGFGNQEIDVAIVDFDAMQEGDERFVFFPLVSDIDTWGDEENNAKQIVAQYREV